MVNVKTSGLVALVAIIVLGVFISLSALVTQVPVENVPVLLQGIWGYIVTFFVLAPVVTVIALGRNIYGYLVEYFKSEYSEEYNFSKLGETLTFYIGIVTTILAAIEPISSIVPASYKDIVVAVMAIGAAVIVILDLVRQQFNVVGE